MNAETIGRYRIQSELGRGAMGRVLLAHDPEIDRPVAIKTVQIFADLPESERGEARERFLREARAAGRLSHPGIVTVFDVGQHAGVPYMAMEYVQGQGLDAFCEPDSLLPPAVAVELVARVAEALAYAHRQGVVHGDVKPANLMRIGERDVKIMDFGLAKDPRAGMTRDGALYGTPSYMSPEQIRGEEIDGRSDLFSLGCVLAELLGGVKAFPGDTVSSVIYRVVHERPGGPDGLDTVLPEPLRPVVERALAKSRDDRHPTGDALAEDLRAAAARLSAAAALAPSPPDAPAGEPGALPPARGRRKHSGAFLAVGMAVVVAALGVGAWYYTQTMRADGSGRFGAEDARPETAPAGVEGEAASPPAAAAGRLLTAAVRTDPPGLPVTLDGEPWEGEVVEFDGGGPYPTLATRQGCRTVEHVVSPADAGREVVLVPDPVETEAIVETDVAGARVSLNGGEAVPAPAAVALDLCAENVVVVEAPRHRPARVVLEPGATPLDARTRLEGVLLEPIPYGTVRVPRGPVAVEVYVDGERVAPAGGAVEVEAGSHRLRVVNLDHFIDVTAPFDLARGQEVTPLRDLPALAEIGVQSFPPNARVSLRPAGGAWRFVATTPMTHRVAAGRYTVRVESPSGAVRERDLELGAGANPPVRVSFVGGGT